MRQMYCLEGVSSDVVLQHEWEIMEWAANSSTWRHHKKIILLKHASGISIGDPIVFVPLQAQQLRVVFDFTSSSDFECVMRRNGACAVSSSAVKRAWERFERRICNIPRLRRCCRHLGCWVVGFFRGASCLLQVSACVGSLVSRCQLHGHFVFEVAVTSEADAVISGGQNCLFASLVPPFWDSEEAFW